MRSILENADPNSMRWCNDGVPLNPNDPNYMSINQRLVGKANPKTHIQPVMPVPAADLSYWKSNNLVTHSNVNTQTQFDSYQSGYQVSDCCKTAKCKHRVSQEGYCPPTACFANRREKSNLNPHPPGPPPKPRPNPIPPYGGGGSSGTPISKPIPPYGGGKVDHLRPGEVIETFEHDMEDLDVNHVNMACGYNVDQIKDGLPVNLSVGDCDRAPEMRDYNKQLFTQTIQPGVYTRNQVNEPINSNIGISFDQQFNPTVTEVNSQGDILYTQMDPAVIEPITVENMSVIEDIDNSNVYDPRHTGYGTSYRAYTNDDLGRTDFYYKDVDAIRMPNYITRSNIDFEKYADQYGPLPQGYADGNPNTNNIREFAQDSFLKSSLGFRNDITFRKMRKTNAEQWQRRRAPKSAPVFMAGSMSLRA